MDPFDDPALRETLRDALRPYVEADFMAITPAELSANSERVLAAIKALGTAPEQSRGYSGNMAAAAPNISARYASAPLQPRLGFKSRLAAAAAVLGVVTAAVSWYIAADRYELVVNVHHSDSRDGRNNRLRLKVTGHREGFASVLVIDDAGNITILPERRDKALRVSYDRSEGVYLTSDFIRDTGRRSIVIVFVTKSDTRDILNSIVGRYRAPAGMDVDSRAALIQQRVLAYLRQAGHAWCDTGTAPFNDERLNNENP